MAAREWNYRGEAGATRPSYTGPMASRTAVDRCSRGAPPRCVRPALSFSPSRPYDDGPRVPQSRDFFLQFVPGARRT